MIAYSMYLVMVCNTVVPNLLWTLNIDPHPCSMIVVYIEFGMYNFCKCSIVITYDSPYIVRLSYTKIHFLNMYVACTLLCFNWYLIFLDFVGSYSSLPTTFTLISPLIFTFNNIHIYYYQHFL